MSKKKFTKMGETPNSYRCTNIKCKWEGAEEEKDSRLIDGNYTEYICPKCGKDEFFGLL